MRICPICCMPYLEKIDNMGPPDHIERATLYSHRMLSKNLSTYQADGCLAVQSVSRLVKYPEQDFSPSQAGLIHVQ